MHNVVTVNQGMELNEYLTRQYLDMIFHHANKEVSSLSAALDRAILTPNVGDHLVTPRIGYTHHGIYAGDERVIHYSGFGDGLSSGPVLEVSLESFCCQRPFQVREHPHRTYARNIAVRRARTRLNEENYSLAFNNCEHFVYWCIYDKSKSLQVVDAGKVIAQSVRRVPLLNAGVALVEAAGSVKSYIEGKISKERLFEEVSETAVSASSIAYYSMLGQGAIPIPGVGAVIGAGIGYMVGNLLNHSGLIALGDSRIVRQAKQRRREIEALCEILVPEIRKSRDQLEKYLELYFQDRKVVFINSFDKIGQSLEAWDSDAFGEALQGINEQFGKKLKYQSFDDFSAAMNGNEPLSFSIKAIKGVRAI